MTATAAAQGWPFRHLLLAAARETACSGSRAAAMAATSSSTMRWLPTAGQPPDSAGLLCALGWVDAALRSLRTARCAASSCG